MDHGISLWLDRDDIVAMLESRGIPEGALEQMRLEDVQHDSTGDEWQINILLESAPEADPPPTPEADPPPTPEAMVYIYLAHLRKVTLLRERILEEVKQSTVGVSSADAIAGQLYWTDRLPTNGQWIAGRPSISDPGVQILTWALGFDVQVRAMPHREIPIPLMVPEGKPGYVVWFDADTPEWATPGDAE